MNNILREMLIEVLHETSKVIGSGKTLEEAKECVAGISNYDVEQIFAEAMHKYKNKE